MTAVAGYDIDELLRDFRVNGFAVFEGLIPHETIDHILECWGPVRDTDIKTQGEFPVRGRFRYNVRVPFREPFVDPDIFEHPALVAFLEAELGEDYVFSHFDSNIPLTGTGYQKWHRDGRASLFPGIRTPAHVIGVKFPLCDTNEENGSFEVLPASQHVHADDLPDDLNSVFGDGPEVSGPFHPVRLNLKKGSLWVQHGRAIHRGTPNRSEQPRDELCMGFSRSWVLSGWQIENTEPHFPKALRDSLSDHARQVLRWQRVKDD